MKKRLFAAALVLVCALMMSGCTLVRGFEKDVQIVLDVDGTVTEGGIVNIFNNTIVNEPAATSGKEFRGWTTLDSWEESEAADVPVIPNKGLVRYNDIKDAVKGDNRSVVLKAVFTPAPRKDLVIAWYNKETTSGLNQGHIDAFRDKLYEYLTSEGMQPENMAIVIRGYEGGVADTCAAISKDGDVDFMLGWSSSSNLTGTGGWTEGVDFVENIGGITAGEKARYIARISDTELCLKVYAWVQSAYGTEETDSAPAATAAPAVPVNQNDGRLVIGWYAKSETSGMDESMAAALEAAVRAEFAGVNDIVVRPYDGKVAEVQDAVLKDGDVDVIVGMKAFALEGIEMEVQENVVMGEKTDRRIHRVSGDELAVAAFEWLKTDSARSLFVSAPAQAESTEAEPVIETAAVETPVAQETPVTEETAVTEAAPANRLVIGWYAKSETSGMDENMAAALEAALKARYENIEVIVRPYNGVVADVQAAVIADGDVDVMVGMKKFELEGIEMEVQNDVVMGEKTDRRIHRISASELSAEVFKWFETDEARSLFKPV